MSGIRVAVVGVGRLGQHHARIYAENPRTDLVAVVDTDAPLGQKIARMWNTQALTDYRRLLGRVDAVSIAVPTVMHFELAREFLGAGVHVLVEKPITSTVPQARELVNLARKHHRVLQVGHVERFNAAIVRLREIIRCPAFIEVHRLGPYDPRVQDIGVVLDLMIHDIDIILDVVKSPVESIDAVGVGIFSDKEDIANARIHFQSGCVANITASRITPKKTRKIRFFQEDTYISIDYMKPAMEIYRKQPVAAPRPGMPPVEIVRKRVRLKVQEPLKAELEHFVDCVEQGMTPQITGEKASDALELAVEISEMIKRNGATMRERLLAAGV
jgi:predicted dehydrogenase